MISLNLKLLSQDLIVTCARHKRILQTSAFPGVCPRLGAIIVFKTHSFQSHSGVPGRSRESFLSLLGWARDEMEMQ